MTLSKFPQWELQQNKKIKNDIIITTYMQVNSFFVRIHVNWVEAQYA